MADRDTIVAVVTLSDDTASLQRFTDALGEAIERRRGTPRPPVTAAAWIVEPQLVVPPRDAFFGTAETVPSSQAVGRACAELIAPYPPGVAALAPGELVTAEALAALSEARSDGVRIAYAADPELQTIEVLRSQ